jgi:parallel beta-helix repeat protein
MGLGERKLLKKRIVSGIMLILLVIGMLTLAFNIQPAKAAPKTIIVPDNYSTIQEAIDNAASGDTIFVRSGTYSEHIEINKSLILKEESSQNTTIKAKMKIDLFGIHITASNVTLTGFRITYDVAPTILMSIDGRNGTCFNNTIKGNVFINIITDTLDIRISNGNHILDNIIYGDKDTSGIDLTYSSFNIVKNNAVVGGFMGIYDNWGGNNLILDNFMTHQVVWEDITGAITFQFVSNNTVVGNTFIENERAIDIFKSSNNTIYHNNFINNTVQVVSTPEYKNFWDDGYPSGGNYWSDYNDTDLYSGPYQNETGSDGVGDVRYVIDENNQDNYPLMSPWTPAFRLVGDINGDGKVDIQDLVLFIKAFGSYPTHPRWNIEADLNNDSKVDIKDLVLIIKHFGEHYP